MTANGGWAWYPQLPKEFGTGSDTNTKGWCDLLAKDAFEGTDGQSSPHTAIVRHNRAAFLATRDTGAMPVDYMAQGAATAEVKAVNGRDDLYVNVNPNLKGSKHWDFTVQRAGPAGTWKKVGSYSSQGRSESRTVNLPKGRYRVVVKANQGLVGSISKKVTLVK